MNSTSISWRQSCCAEGSCRACLSASPPFINMTSGLALAPKQSASGYCASKAALHSFSKTLRWQLEDSSVKVFECLPPLVDTAMTAARGKSKISPERLADELWRGLERDYFGMRIGLTRALGLLHRLAPRFTKRRVRFAD